MGKFKHKDGQASIPVGIAMGLGLSLLLTFAGTALTAALIDGGRLSPAQTGWPAVLIRFLAAASGAWLSIERIKRKKLQMGLLTGGCYLLVLLSTTALFFEGQYGGLWQGALAVLLGSLAVSVLSAGRGGRSKNRVIKKAYR